MLNKLVFCFVFFLASNEAMGLSNGRSTPPVAQSLQRHLRFQAGKLGDKPWEYEASFGVQANFFSAVFSKLVSVDSNYQIKPGIIKKWSWDYKKNQFIFDIDIELKFSEERHLRPQDVEFALVKSFLSDKGNYYRDRLGDIVGVNNLVKGQKFRSGICAGIQVIGEDKLAVKLKKNSPGFLYMLENSVPPVAPIEEFEADLFSFKGLPKGTGKYFVEWSSEKNSLVRLKHKEYKVLKNEKNLFPLTIDFFNHGDPEKNNIDLATAAGSSGIRRHPKYTTLLGNIPEAIFTIDFNYSTPLAKNKHFRKAIALALNKKEIHEGYIQNKPLYSVIPSKYLGHGGSDDVFNPEESKKIVEKYLKDISSKDKPIKGIFHGRPGAPKKPHIVAIEKQLRDVGLFVDFQGRSVVIQFGEDKDAILKENGFSVSFVDPVSAVARFISRSEEKNLIAYPDDPLLKKLYREAKTTKSKAIKAEKLRRLANRLKHEFYTIPMGEGYPIFSYTKKVKSIDVENIFAAVNFEKVVLETK